MDQDQANNKKMEKLQMFAQSPQLAMFDMLDEINSKLEALGQVFKDLDLSEVDSIKGDTPEKGKDYFTEDEIAELKDMLAEDTTPVKGVHYFDGDTPEKGVDYDTEEEKAQLWEEITKYIDKKLKK